MCMFGTGKADDLEEDELAAMLKAEAEAAAGAKAVAVAKAAAEAKLEALGLTPDDLKALGL